MTYADELYPLTRRIQSLIGPDDDVHQLFQDFHGRRETFARKTEFCVAGATRPRAGIVVSGWMLRTHLLNDGRRQVLGYVLPGDLVNFSLHSAVPSFCDVECVTDVVIADASALRRHVLTETGSDPVTSAIWLLLALDETIAMNAVARLTRQSAYERLGHFLLDLRYRLALIGASDDGSFDLPLTQQSMGEALALSVVHVNRVLMQLRRDGMVERTRKRIQLPDPDQLARRVDYSAPHIVPRNVRRIDRTNGIAGACFAA